MIIGYIKAAVEVITGFNELVTFSQWFKSLRSHSNGTEKQELKEDVLKLQTSFQCLRDTLPAMYNFINRVEWRSHEEGVAELLPELKAAIYDAEDLLEDFQSYVQKVKIEGSATSAEPGTKFFQDSSQDNFDTKLTAIKNRLDNQSKTLERMGLHQGTLRFDRSVRPETTSLPTEAKIFGRDEEIKRLIKLLGVPANNSRGPSTRKRPRSDNTEVTITSVPVLPIVGIGGVGKTTLAQNFCSHPKVKQHFDVIVWICISDDFDVKRLTKEAIEHFSGKAPSKDNLNSLQADLTHSFNKRRFLVVLDNMWAENEELWKMFYALFKHALEGSMMIVTTRSQKVGDIVRTMDPFPLEGLKDDELQKFFKLCVFGPNISNNNSELEQIGKKILPKLKGSPLAAKTIGRLLGMSLDIAHWNMILNSQLWEHRQQETDILPALRLSYLYLPFYLKRCFSFCAVYPKDHNFEKDDLAEIWVAEGFVEPEHNIPLQQTGCKYFEELVHLSFFQKLRGKYVIHDLIHDMAQLVSKDECFIVKEEKDLERIPQNVRHLSVLKSRGFKCCSLSTLCKQTKLRTLLCDTSLKSKAGYTVMEKWCTELLCMRVMVCASVSESFGLPDSIGNMRNLRCLKILDSCNFKRIPATFCHLYNLQLFYARKSRFWVVPKGFRNLINLRKFESKFLKIDSSFNRVLCTCYADQISKDQAVGIGIMKEEYISSLTLIWSMFDSLRSPGHDEIEMFKALHPPTNIKSVCIDSYPGEYLPNWCLGSDNTAVFTSLTVLRVTDCSRLSSLEQFLQPAYMPAIKKLVIRDCPSLVSIPVERFGGFLSLEELEVCNCPEINSQCLLAPSLKKLVLEDSGNPVDDIDCCSLVTFHISRYRLESLIFNRKKLPLLNELHIRSCLDLKTINGGCPNLEWLTISKCPRLRWENGIVLPLSLQNLEIDGCDSFSGKRLENLTSLQSLKIHSCNDIEYIPRDLWSSNFKSLQVLKIWHCEELVSIGGPEAIAHIPTVHIRECPKLKEVQQPLARGSPLPFF